MVLHEGFPVPKSVQDTGFDAPEINSFGHSFRDYDAKSERQQTVEEFYRVNHINQTYDFSGFETPNEAPPPQQST
ncbi:unnamed protein product [Camellia sinensis]